MTTNKQGLQVKVDEKGEPVAILFRTKSGHWVWYGVQVLDEEGQVALIEKEIIEYKVDNKVVATKYLW